MSIVLSLLVFSFKMNPLQMEQLRFNDIFIRLCCGLAETNKAYHHYRNAICDLKGKNEIRLTKVLLGKKTIIATLPWKEKSVILRLVAKGATLTFYAGLSNDMLYQVGEVQSVDAVSDNKVNRFNGTGVGIYATSNGKQSINKASYQWFEYKEEN